MEQVIIGVDPHKLSATIEVVDDREQCWRGPVRHGQGRVRRDAKRLRQGVAVTGVGRRRSGGVGRPLAQRLLGRGERSSTSRRSPARA